MPRVVQTLRSLFQRTLSEHGRDAPALTDITVERGCRRFRPRLGAHFSNGYRAWAAFSPSDCYDFCERHAAWELESLRRALLREAQVIYALMFEDHMVGLRLIERRRRRLEEARPSRTALTEQLRRLSALTRNFRAQPVDPFAGAGSEEAQQRGMRLLEENLAPAQREQYRKHHYFDVVGGKSGTRYRIRHGRGMNIEQIDEQGRRVCVWCFVPEGRLVAGDVMLAQKTALELFEAEALRVANRFG